MEPKSPSEPQATLSVFDAVCIIVGIVIGSSIYEVPPLIFSNVSGPWMGLGAWLLGGILALVGAFVYAELATTYPRIGGDYVYLTRAFGRPVGFLFGWAQLTAILTASIGSMAFVFANAADNLFFAHSGSSEDRRALLAAASVTVLSLLNIAGVVFGKWTQNLLSVVKIVGLGAITVAGLALARSDALNVPADYQAGPMGFGFAMIMVLYAYGGWNDAAFVAGEVRNVRRNLPLALFLGVGLITLIYLLVNLAYLLGLGFEGVQQPDVPGRLLLAFLGKHGSAAMHVIIMISALGAVNGLIFTGARIYSALGTEHRVFAWLAQWHPRLGSPHWSLLLQWLIALLMIVGVGTEAGRHAIDTVVAQLVGVHIPWQQYFGGFGTLVAATAPIFWIFFLMTGLSLFVLRLVDKDRERPFYMPIPLYPVVPIIFCLTCAWMLYNSVAYAKWLAALFSVPVLAGVLVYLVSGKSNQAHL
ncbi:MAG: amino acid permease [Gemmatales bacterium]|nr:amino acid permease [Gemmatales bacterium]MDW7995887.1 amino acid permease [Gemmatales bacterium]